MTTALANVNGGHQQLDTLTLADAFVKSGFFADTKQQAQAIVKITYGQEIGVGPVAAMMNIHIINGKPSLSSNLIAAMIKRSGRYDYTVKQWDAKGCVLEFTAGDKVCGVSSFTIEEAKQAGVLNNPTWGKYPKNMLFARALTNGARAYCADVFLGAVYTPEEMGANVDEHGEIIDVTPTALEQPTTASVTLPAVPERVQFTSDPTARKALLKSIAQRAKMYERGGDTLLKLATALGVHKKTEDMSEMELADFWDKLEPIKTGSDVDRVIAQFEARDTSSELFDGIEDRPNLEGL